MEGGSSAKKGCECHTQSCCRIWLSIIGLAFLGVSVFFMINHQLGPDKAILPFHVPDGWQGVATFGGSGLATVLFAGVTWKAVNRSKAKNDGKFKWSRWGKALAIFSFLLVGSAIAIIFMTAFGAQFSSQFGTGGGILTLVLAGSCGLGLLGTWVTMAVNSTVNVQPAIQDDQFSPPNQAGMPGSSPQAGPSAEVLVEDPSDPDGTPKASNLQERRRLLESLLSQCACPAIDL